MIRIDDESFFHIVDYLKQNYGLDLTKKKVLVECRLTKVLQSLGIDNFPEYVQSIDKDQTGTLIEQMVDTLTTHYTYFLRENEHFQFLKDTLLPAFEEMKKNHVYQIWCAGCSTGEEAYCLAMSIEDYKKQTGSSLDYHILATDISHHVLDIARKGQYSLKQLATIDPYWQLQYCQVQNNDFFSINKDIQKHVTFNKHNLMEPLKVERQFDLILCRNVMIYFHKDMRYQIVKSLEDHLYNNGYLMIGHAEMLSTKETQLKTVFPSVYRKGDIEKNEKNYDCR